MDGALGFIGFKKAAVISVCTSAYVDDVQIFKKANWLNFFYFSCY